MKTTMKSLIVLALALGMSGLAHAGRQGNGWNVTLVTGTAQVIFTGRGYVRRIEVSSPTTGSIGDQYLVAYTSNPTSVAGAGTLLISTAGPWNASYQITPPILFKSTTTLNSNLDTTNNYWSAGGCEECYIEVPGEAAPTIGSSPGGGGLTIRKTSEASGGAFNASVIWSR